MNRWERLSSDEIRLVEAVFWGPGQSRHAIADRIRFSKSKCNSLLAGLIGQGLVSESGLSTSSGGRRAETLRLDPALGVVLGVDIGATSLDVAVLTPELLPLAHHAEAADLSSQGPGVVMARLKELMHRLLAQAGCRPQQVLGIGIGVPGPVDFNSGQLVNPPLMPGWDGFSVRDYLHSIFPVPVFVDNDVNLMALGELWRLQRGIPNFLVIKIGTGIGCGIVCHGEIYRGATGSAGDVGHICVDQEGPRCHCGNLGCVEVMAAGPAIVRMATEAALSGRSPRMAERLRAAGRLDAIDVGAASHAGDAAANGIIQRAGHLIGQMLASVVNFFNPSQVFLGGGITQVGPLLLAAVRQSVYQRSLALSTRHLEVSYSPLASGAGLTGAGVLALHETLRTRGLAP